jgi:beta-barrel assembly-enhancing protease
MKIQRRAFLVSCALPLLGHAAPARFARPDPASDEGGLWAYMDREEERVRRSAFLIRDPALNAYVRDIACRLAGEHCADLRVYLVRTPHFNAWMAPNGMMQIWSGLLLRMANEAQLAAMIAHEVGHYLERHGVERLRDAKSRSALGQLVSIALSPVALVGGALSSVALGSAAHFGIATGGLAYRRDHEREADRIGVDLMAQAGYAPMEAARVWTQLREEREAGGTREPGLLFASHPPAEEREQSLTEFSSGKKEGKVGADSYRAALAPHRSLFLHDEVQRRRFGETNALLERLLKSAPADGELWFFRGETCRLRGERGDAEGALEAYRTARDLPGAPPEVHRSMGLVLQRLGRTKEASSAFLRYLDLKPGGADAELLRTYL